jgi:formate dehydrogenase subunit gamma
MSGKAETAADRACARWGDDPAALIEILHDLQAEVGFVPQDALPGIAKRLNLSRAEVHGVVSFYHDFRDRPAGPVVVKVCRAEACQSMGALALIERICARHRVELGGTAVTGVTIEPVYCLGNCACAPAAMVDGRLHGRLDADRLARLIDEAR